MQRRGPSLPYVHSDMTSGIRVRLADSWFRRIEHGHGVTQLFEPHVHPIIRCNIWHVRGRDRDLVVDTGVGVVSVMGAISDLVDRPVLCVATHAHYDHIGSLSEFDNRLMHPIAAAQMDTNLVRMPLRWSAFEPEMVESARSVGYEVDGDVLIDALPAPGFDVDRLYIAGALATEVVGEGSVVDLGDRQFEVLELPGHSPDSIGLWEPSTRMFFSGDAIYAGPLVDFLPESNLADYQTTMKRLRNLPAEVVHAGHYASFGRARLIEIADSYLENGRPFGGG